MRPPLFELLEVFRDVLGKENVAGVTAIHHPLGHIDAGAGHVGAPVHIDYTTNRSAVRCPSVIAVVGVPLSARLISKAHSTGASGLS